jgi:hypothetical protein
MPKITYKNYLGLVLALENYRNCWFIVSSSFLYFSLKNYSAAFFYATSALYSLVKKVLQLNRD